MEPPNTAAGNRNFVRLELFRRDRTWARALNAAVIHIEATHRIQTVDLDEPDPERELIRWANEIRTGRPLTEIWTEVIERNIRDSEAEAEAETS